MRTAILDRPRTECRLPVNRRFTPETHQHRKQAWKLEPQMPQNLPFEECLKGKLDFLKFKMPRKLPLQCFDEKCTLCKTIVPSNVSGWTNCTKNSFEIHVGKMISRELETTLGLFERNFFKLGLHSFWASSVLFPSWMTSRRMFFIDVLKKQANTLWVKKNDFKVSNVLIKKVLFSLFVKSFKNTSSLRWFHDSFLPFLRRTEPKLRIVWWWTFVSLFSFL